MNFRVSKYLVCCVLFLNMQAAAYDFMPGDWFLTPKVGAVINVARYKALFSSTPEVGFLIGADLEYMMTDFTAIYGSLYPYVAADNINVGFAAGAKYRIIDWLNPVILYGSAGVSSGFLFSLETNGKIHANVGVKLGIGLEYFVLRNLAIDFAIDLEPSVMFMAGKTSFEFSIEPVLGVLWRI